MLIVFVEDRITVALVVVAGVFITAIMPFNSSKREGEGDEDESLKTI